MYLLVLLFLLGLVLGSFITALSWRLPRDKSINKGRSVCDKCDKEIAWYDNIPLFSYLFLGGKCRSCDKKISLRYPLIELATGLLFFILGYTLLSCSSLLFDSPLCYYQKILGDLALPFFLTIAVLMVAIFVIDLELQIIPDLLVYLLLILVIFLLLLTNIYIWEHLLAGFSAALFLLSLHLITRGKGMGLGDVKLALPVGILLGIKLMITWLFLGFLIGAVVGVVLLVLKKAEFGKHIPFGPFLVISFFLVIIFGGLLENYLFI